MPIGTIVPFPAAELADYPTSPSIDGSVKKLASNANFSSLGIGLIDLTPPLPTSGALYGGANDDSVKYIASTCKIAPMYAAFQLRDSVANALAGINRQPGETPALILAQASKQLQSLVSSPYWNGFPRDFPDLSLILDFTSDANGPGWTVDFRTTRQSWDELHALDPDLEHPISLKTVQKYGLWEQLEMMIGMSDNCASMACIQALGFQYINGVLAKAGFFKNNKGIWLGSSYARACTGEPPKWKPVPGPVLPSERGYQVGSARALAKFMARLDERQLASANSSFVMLNLMNKNAAPGNATKSFFEEGLKKNFPEDTFVVCSKLGVADSPVADAAIVQHTTKGGALTRYAAVGIADPNPSNEGLLESLIVELDRLITSLH